MALRRMAKMDISGGDLDDVKGGGQELLQRKNLLGQGMVSSGGILLLSLV